MALVLIGDVKTIEKLNAERFALDYAQLMQVAKSGLDAFKATTLMDIIAHMDGLKIAIAPTKLPMDPTVWQSMRTIYLGHVVKAMTAAGDAEGVERARGMINAQVSPYHLRRAPAAAVAQLRA